ncbi:general substrate transporter [Aspergillus similis]
MAIEKSSNHSNIETLTRADSADATADARAKSALASDNIFEHEQTVLQVLRGHPVLIWWAFFFSVSAIGWGFDAQVNGAVLSIPSFRRDFGEHFDGDFVVPAPWLSAFNSISSVGQFFGGFICSAVADRVGRRLALAVGVLISCGGIFGELFSTARVAFLISKLILGVGLGFYLTIGPLYSSEVSPVVLRGITTAGVNLGIVIGQLLSNAAIKGFGDRGDRWAYRGPFAIQIFFVAFLGLGLPFSVESPWYLVRHNRIDDARNALQQLYGAGTDVETKLVAIRLTVAQDLAARESKWSDAVRGPNLLRTTISCGVFVCQHLVGIIFVLGFSAYFFQLAGLPTERSFDLGVGVTACGVVGTMISWLIVNHLGRRIIFNTGMAILSTINLLIGILDVVPTSGASWTQAALTVVWAFFYQVSIGAVAFVLLGETSSPSLRAKTTAMATATQAVFGIVMNIVIPYMVNPDEGNMQGKVGFVFGGLGAVATVLCYLYIPDLKDRTFEEIDLMFENRVPPRKMGRYVIEH